MSNARKCDACGALFECPYTPDIKITVYCHPYGETGKDLCAKCYAKLEAFLHIPQGARNVKNNEWILPG